MELGAPIGANASPVKHYQFTASDVSSTATKSASFNTGQTAVNGHSDPMRGQHYTAPGPPVVQPAETDSEPVSQIETASSDVVERIAPEPTANHSSDVNSQPATATIDPNVPSSGSKPTALPTDPSTHPEEMRQGIEEEHPAVVSREFEKTRAEERELKGERPEGTVVAGLEDDRLYAMLRRFDTVGRSSLISRIQLTSASSKSPMSCIPRQNSLLPNRIYVLRHYPISHPIPRHSKRTLSARSQLSGPRQFEECGKLSVSCLGLPKKGGGPGLSVPHTSPAGFLDMLSQVFSASLLP